jgi:NADH-quinone oxidoreductase subunit F
MGSCGLAAGAEAVQSAVPHALTRLGIEAEVRSTGCLGLCHREVLLEIDSPEVGRCTYGDVTPDRVEPVLAAHLVDRRPLSEHLVRGAGVPSAVLDAQDRVVLRNCGLVDPSSLEDHLRHGGFAGLERALDMDPAAVADLIYRAGLRGRGGAGFSTGLKWQLAAASADPVRTVVCNADEGDPGAFMDRNLMESDPFSVLEGMMIAAWATGAQQGFVFVRFEYPLATRRIERAIEAARTAGWLGERVGGRPFSFDVKVRRGAGAFVCGEETALIASLEGHRGVPVLKPPYPTTRGYLGHPTVINNVETLSAVPWILAHGADAFRERGTKESPGTKVFCLAGDVRNGGMVEVEMGTPVRAVFEALGGGPPAGRRIKAVQIGGPSGGCLPAHLFDVPIEYDALAHTGSMMGSGGLVFLDDSRCMVDVARYFVRFMRDESCGKCTACREGTARMTEILDRICSGHGRPGDIELLEDLSGHVRGASICGLGKTAPNPVETTLRYFRKEYEAHVFEGRCPTFTCKSLIRYEIDRANCDGCSVCLRECPVDAIHLERSVIPLTIDPGSCIRCDACRDVCPFDAVSVQSGV